MVNKNNSLGTHIVCVLPQPLSAVVGQLWVAVRLFIG